MRERCGRLAGVGPARTAASDLVARYAVVLDSCVLVPIALADTLLRLAERDLYRPLWSTRIVAKATDAIVDIHPEIPPERVRTRFAAMDDAFEDACVEGWETLEHTVTLPDADDPEGHVLVAGTLDLAGRAHAEAVGVEQQRHHRLSTVCAAATPVVAVVAVEGGARSRSKPQSVRLVTVWPSMPVR